MRNPGGHAQSFYPEGHTVECDTFTCNHCQRVTFVWPGMSAYDLGGGCRICNKLICSKCVDKGTCTPWEEQMEINARKFETDRIVSQIVGR